MIKIISVIFAATIISCGSTTPLSKTVISEKWENFKVEFNRVYATPEEEQFRKKVFEDTLYFIEEHNKKYVQGNTTFEVGVTMFADYTQEELEIAFAPCDIPSDDSLNQYGIPLFFEGVELESTGDSVDYRGIMTPVKNQGNCGSCYAFAVVGALEARIKKNNLPEVILSEQQIVDCDTSNDHCVNGDRQKAYIYMFMNGIDTQSSYPYTSGTTDVAGTCSRIPTGNSNTPLRGYGYIDPSVVSREYVMAQVVKKCGPVSTGIYISDADLQAFSKFVGDGYFTSSDCENARTTTHAIVIAGYGTDANGIDFWLIKNSHGTSWGDNGYGKIYRNRNNYCGIALHVNYPLLNLDSDKNCLDL